MSTIFLVVFQETRSALYDFVRESILFKVYSDIQSIEVFFRKRPSHFTESATSEMHSVLLSQAVM